jgi:hypothetical protein
MRDNPRLRIGLTALLAALSASAARAQTCAGAPSLRTVGYRVGGGAGFGKNVRLLSLAGAGGLPGSPLYATASVGRLSLLSLDRTAITTGLSVAFEAPLDGARASGVCPFVSAGTQTGPKNIGNTGIDYSDVELGAGLAIGRELRRWDAGSISLALEGFYQGLFYRYRSSTGHVSDSHSQSALTLTLGVAMGRVLCRANLSQPADLTLSPTSFGVQIAIMGAPRRTASRLGPVHH